MIELSLYIGPGKNSQVGAFDKASAMAAYPYLCRRVITAIAQPITNSSHYCNHQILPPKMGRSGGIGPVAVSELHHFILWVLRAGSGFIQNYFLLFISNSDTNQFGKNRLGFVRQLAGILLDVSGEMKIPGLWASIIQGL
jgi:hypothetical protein